MLTRLAAIAVLLIAGLAAMPAMAASFDCSKATTPFEHAICDMPELSAADEVLAKAYATATGGLTKPSATLMRADQRGWLDFAQRACTDDAEPLASGRYDAEGGSCLLDAFNARISALEGSRMLGGHRFYLKSLYAVLPDPVEAGNPDSYWKVASHALTLPLLDGDDALAASFNDYVTESAASQTDIGAAPDDLDPSADTSVTITVKDLAGASRITLEMGTYWYGHGAAHGNWSVSYLHYYVPEQRGLVASDIFGGDDWEDILTEAAWAQLQIEHKDWLQVEAASDIAEIVVDPTRWDFSDDYGLIVQFEPYEVSAYAYGAPTITIPWDGLDGIKAANQDVVRYGS